MEGLLPQLPVEIIAIILSHLIRKKLDFYRFSLFSKRIYNALLNVPQVWAILLDLQRKQLWSSVRYLCLIEDKEVPFRIWNGYLCVWEEFNVGMQSSSDDEDEEDQDELGTDWMRVPLYCPHVPSSWLSLRALVSLYGRAYRVAKALRGCGLFFSKDWLSNLRQTEIEGFAFWCTGKDAGSSSITMTSALEDAVNFRSTGTLEKTQYPEFFKDKVRWKQRRDQNLPRFQVQPQGNFHAFISLLWDTQGEHSVQRCLVQQVLDVCTTLSLEKWTVEMAVRNKDAGSTLVSYNIVDGVCYGVVIRSSP